MSDSVISLTRDFIASFQMSSKDNEVKLLHREINSLRGEYEKLVEIKQALAMEITIYRNIIEGEEKRIRK